MKKKIKTKLVMIHDYPPKEGGGVEVNVYKTSLALSKLNYDVKIATSRFKSETFEHTNIEKDKNIGIHLIQSYEDLHKIIEWADIVHIHFTFSFRPASINALRICCLLKKKCVFSIRTAYEHLPFSSFFDRTILEKDIMLKELKSLLSQDNVFISAPSKSLESSLKKIGLKKELHVINNGTDFKFKKSQVNSNITTVDLTYVGELSFLKGVNYLVDAIKIIKRKKKDIKLRLIGNGSDEAHMKRLVDFFDLHDNVEFVGYVYNGEVLDYLQKTKVYVQPSLTEAWGNSVVEAMALGIPVICTNVGGLLELSEHGKLAKLVSCGDSYELASAILETLDKNNYKSVKLKANSTARKIKRRLTIENQSLRLDSLYGKVLEH